MAGLGFEDVLRVRDLCADGVHCAEIACLYCSRFRNASPELIRPRLRQLIARIVRVRRRLASERFVLEFVLSAASEHVRPEYLSKLELPPAVVAHNPSLMGRPGYEVADILMGVTTKCVNAYLEDDGSEVASEASFFKLEKALEAVVPEVERESRLAIRLLMTHPAAAELFSAITTLHPRKHDDEAGGVEDHGLPSEEKDANFCLDALRLRRENSRDVAAFIRDRAERNVETGEARNVASERLRLTDAERRFRSSIGRLGVIPFRDTANDDAAGEEE